jgi:uncharacterized repeat protein (TIGR03803 family)
MRGRSTITTESRESGEEGNMGKSNWWMRACAIFLLWATAAVALPAQTFTTIYSFDQNVMDGSGPYAGLVQGTNGKFYGTTSSGGNDGIGTVFSITSGGALITLHSFDDTDGNSPAAGLIQGTNGKFYGTTYAGGANGYGTIFSIAAAGTLITLRSFDRTDGSYPQAGLIQGTNGKFYGTTSGGGANGMGTIFSITAGGTLTTLYSFCSQANCADGANPVAGLVQGTDGKFYGTTDSGGAHAHGTVFSITAGGTLFTLHSFNSIDGDAPQAGLVEGANGKFYGTTKLGGTNSDGTVFSITTGGFLTTIYSFCSQTGCTDGQYPEAALVQGTDGKFYGTTAGAGPNYCTVFSITGGGALRTLHSFAGHPTDGSDPLAGLLQGTNGKFYGTTFEGGANAGGTVFSLSVGLGPFVETRPASGAVGAAVAILGTNLTGATAVTFNGTAAAFTVKSKSEITTTVPTGATTGTVQVVTPGGTLSSNVPFTVN